ncbi:hypothetical protein C8J56DRAFT_591716 [Mycena floridula]|nr:hypothetical protein C8J56DRAFT_591716 [Mycena floridula]
MKKVTSPLPSATVSLAVKPRAALEAAEQAEIAELKAFEWSSSSQRASSSPTKSGSPPDSMSPLDSSTALETFFGDLDHTSMGCEPTVYKPKPSIPNSLGLPKRKSRPGSKPPSSKPNPVQLPKGGLPLTRECSLFLGLPNGWQHHTDYDTAYKEFMDTREEVMAKQREEERAIEEEDLKRMKEGKPPLPYDNTKRPRIPSIAPLLGGRPVHDENDDDDKPMSPNDPVAPDQFPAGHPLSATKSLPPGFKGYPMSREVSLYGGLPNGMKFNGGYDTPLDEFLDKKDELVARQRDEGRPRIPSIVALISGTGGNMAEKEKIIPLERAQTEWPVYEPKKPPTHQWVDPDAQLSPNLSFSSSTSFNSVFSPLSNP